MAEAVREARPIKRLGEGVAAFMHQEASGAIVLAVATVIALVLANSRWAASYEHFWEIRAGIEGGTFVFQQTLRHWVDDTLMALFFFVVGLEIKREFVVGELSTFRGAALPVVAALGGMLVPAAIYLALNVGEPTQQGWGIPMATDIAFALGVLAALGSRMPVGLKVFLVALAIADDLGAILVIALFYTSGISPWWLLMSLVPLGALIMMNRFGVDAPWAYLTVGGVLWFTIFNSGVHATIAGVIAALTVPAVAKLSPSEFTESCRLILDEIDATDVPGAHTLENDHQQMLALSVARSAELSTAPLQRLEYAIHPFTTFVVLPLFALANAGIPLSFGDGVPLSAATLGVVLGLVVGKPLGISLASYIAVKSGLTQLPEGVSWRHIGGAGMLGGIGFTMSLFVANLAFRSAEFTNEIKAAILFASVVAGVVGYVWLRILPHASEEVAS